MLFFPEECTHYFEGHHHSLFDLSATPAYQEASEHRKRLMDYFSEGFKKFMTPPYLSPPMDARPRSHAYAKRAAAARRHPVHEGEDYWKPAKAPFHSKGHYGWSGVQVQVVPRALKDWQFVARILLVYRADQ
jgi:hypothetical protein